MLYTSKSKNKMWTGQKIDEFFKLALKFSEIDSAAMEQTRQENIIDSFDYLEDDKS